MNRREKIELMMERFVHPNSGFAKQIYADGSGKLKEGTYFFRQVDGTCTHNPPHERKKDCSDMKEIIFTEQHMTQHLMGTKTFAPYQLSKEGTIKWLCFDVDAYEGVSTEDIQTTVIEVVKKIYARFGSNHYLVEASGSKGYHIWLFFDRPLDVRFGFSLGHELVQTVDTPNGINIEIYPKQAVSSKRFGNTVKLPLGVHQKTGKRCVFVSSNFSPYDDQWEKLQNVQPISADDVERTVTPYTPPKVDRPYAPRTPLCLVDAMADGTERGMRDEVAFRVACYLRDKGIPEDLGWTTMVEWNKKNAPPLDEDVLRLKWEQGYVGEYSWMPCNSPSFDGLCRSSCALFQRKVERRWFSKKGNPIGKISRD